MVFVVVVYVGFVAAERILYLPSVAFCLLVGYGFQHIASRINSASGSRIALSAAIISLLVSFSCRTVVRNRDWIDEEALFRSAIPINPPKGMLFNKQLLCFKF